MGRHAAPTTAEYAPPAVAAPQPVPPREPVYRAPVVGYLPAPVDPRDDFTAVNLLVPQQQTLPVRALVWGIVAVLLWFAVAPSIFAVVYGVLGARRARRLELAGLGAQGRGMSIAGIALGTVALGLLLLGIAGAVLAAVLTSQAPVRGYPS